MKLWSSRPDAAHNIQKDTGAILSRTSVLIGAMIDRRTDKTAQKEEVGCMYLYAIKACFFCPDSGGGELFDDKLYLIRSHIIWFNLHKAAFDFAVIGSKCKLCDNGNSFCMNEICQVFVLRNEGIITQPHHAPKVVVMKGNTGEACDDGADPALRQFPVDFIRFFCHATVLIGNSLPCGGADKTVL